MSVRRNNQLNFDESEEEIFELTPHEQIEMFCSKLGIRSSVFMNTKRQRPYYFPSKYYQHPSDKFRNDDELFLEAWAKYGECYFGDVLESMNHKLNFKIVNKLFG